MSGFARRYRTFVAFLVILVVTTTALFPKLGAAPALLIGFDAGALLFLALIARLFVTATPATMRRRAADNEPDQLGLTVFALIIVAVVLTGVGVELAGQGMHDKTRILLAAATLTLAWIFANTLFALHYAHLWYLPGRADTAPRRDRGGLAFPGEDTEPDFWDVAYFAFVLGMTFQVSDVAITSRHIRRTALIHGLLAFFYNIGVVALSVSIVANGFSG